MNFSIEESCDEDTTAVWNDSGALTALDRLIARADEADHGIRLWDADLILKSLWATDARQSARDQLLELCELARGSAWIGTNTTACEHRVSTRTEAERALRIANTPLKVLVENRLRDGDLLEVAVRLLGTSQLCRLWIEAPPPPVIEVVHAGGCGEMQSILAREAEQADAAGLPVRMIVVVDSDRTGPDDTPSDTALRIELEADRTGAHAFILCKREAENYIPDFHWRAEIERDPRNPNWKSGIDDLLSKSPVERDYQDMENINKKKVPAKYEQSRPHHLEVLLRRVRQAEDDRATLATMAGDLRTRDHTKDLTTILELIDQER